jgi:hypothetical protein
MTVSAHAAYASSEAPPAAAAFHSRAPSMCTGSPRSSPSRFTSRSASSGTTTPPWRLWVFSTHRTLVRG